MSATCCAANEMTPAEQEDQRDKLILHACARSLCRGPSRRSGANWPAPMT